MNPSPANLRLPTPWRGFRFRSILKALLGVFLLLCLAAVLLPLNSRTCVKGPQTQALAKAKQIGLALKLYAGDHDGIYPAGVNSLGQTIVSSNDAYRDLFPTYTQSEKIFGNPLSAYQTAPPDDIIQPPSEILKPGENVYSYVMGVTDAMAPTTPLVADGTNGAGRGAYAADRHARGGAWAGERAVVVYLDNSAAVERLTGPSNARFIERTTPDGSKFNPLDPKELGPKLRLLDPAVAR